MAFGLVSARDCVVGGEQSRAAGGERPPACHHCAKTEAATGPAAHRARWRRYRARRLTGPAVSADLGVGLVARYLPDKYPGLVLDYSRCPTSPFLGPEAPTKARGRQLILHREPDQ
jgi:hypothetical protein